MTKPTEQPHHRAGFQPVFLQSMDLFLFMNELMFIGPSLESLKVGVGHLKLSSMRLINAVKPV